MFSFSIMEVEVLRREVNLRSKKTLFNFGKNALVSRNLHKMPTDRGGKTDYRAKLVPVGIFNEHFPYIETIPAWTSRKLIKN